LKAIALALVLAAPAVPFVAVPQLRAAPGVQDTPAYDEAFEKARQLLQQHDYFNALKGFQRANLIAGGKSAESFLGMAQAMIGMKVYKNALDACQSAIELSQTNTRVLARAHKLKGQVFKAMGQLPGAESEFRAALSADPDSKVPDLHYELGAVLVAEQRREEGNAELKKEIELRPNGTTAEEARAILTNPRLARERAVPDFSITSTDGRMISPQTLRGRIVLLDFWASWCGPCRHALPAVKKIQQDHANDPFSLISISADREEQAWHSFVTKNGMTWPQFWDEDEKVRRQFDVTVIPTYVLMDAEGIEVMRMKGEGFDSARNLAAEIDRQIKLLSTPHP
jgi:thioredoxin-like negative regulator of GroEL